MGNFCPQCCKEDHNLNQDSNDQKKKLLFEDDVQPVFNFQQNQFDEIKQEVPRRKTQSEQQIFQYQQQEANKEYEQQQQQSIKECKQQYQKAIQESKQQYQEAIQEFKLQQQEAIKEFKQQQQEAIKEYEQKQQQSIKEFKQQYQEAIKECKQQQYQEANQEQEQQLLRQSQEHDSFQTYQYANENFFPELDQICSNLLNNQPQIIKDNQLNKLFHPPALILVCDVITKFTSTQFQTKMALQKYYPKSEINLSENDSLIRDIILKNVVRQMKTLFHVQDDQKLIQNQELLKLFRSLKIVYFVCKYFKWVLKIVITPQCYRDNIVKYNLFYQNFQKLIQNLNDDNELIYNKLFMFVGQKNQYKFQLLGYYMRFWCQIVLSKSYMQTNYIRRNLLESFNNVNREGMNSQLYQYIIGAVDLCSNEYNSNWIGHQNNFLIKKILIDMDHNELCNLYNKDLSSYLEGINNEKQKCKNFYPSWVFNIRYQKFSQDLKLKKLFSEIKDVYKIDIDNKDNIKDNDYLESFSELITGWGLDEKYEGEQQFKIMAKFLLNDKRTLPLRKKQAQSFQQEVQKQSFKYRTQLRIKQKKEVNLEKELEVDEKVKVEQTKIFDKKYFEIFLQTIYEFQKVLKSIENNNFILEQRNYNRQIDQFFGNPQQWDYDFCFQTEIQNEKIFDQYILDIDNSLAKLNINSIKNEFQLKVKKNYLLLI